jgi:hypothetical protein
MTKIFVSRQYKKTFDTRQEPAVETHPGTRIATIEYIIRFTQSEWRYDPEYIVVPFHGGTELCSDTERIQGIFTLQKIPYRRWSVTQQ